VLGLRGNNDGIQECTSQVFEGLITVRDPGTSWVARWQRLDSYVPGTYAVKVTGSVSAASSVLEGGGVGVGRANDGC
jgi:transcription elongation factor SPT4